MRLIIYGDFNCPYSYLASQRADRLARAGTVQAEWRAVEHDQGLPVTGARSEADRAAWESELAEVAALALPGEHAPQAPPPVVSNTGAAVAAYAEAVTDGVADELRRRLFRAIWADGRHISSAYAVRRLVTRVMWPAEDIGDRLASPDIPSVLHRDPDLARIVRRSGGTIAPDGARSPQPAGGGSTTGGMTGWRCPFRPSPRSSAQTASCGPALTDCAISPDWPDMPARQRACSPVRRRNWART